MKENTPADPSKKKRKVGGQPKTIKKKMISLRIDPDVLAYFRNDGPGWQTRLNATLRKIMDEAKVAKK